MYRTNTCGELSLKDQGKRVTLAGWIQGIREFKDMSFVVLRDRYGLTQLVFDEKSPNDVRVLSKTLGREYVVQVEGIVIERSSKNPKMPTGEIEIQVEKLSILNASETPPFTIEDNSDGGDELRMKYRYLDLRRNPLQRNIALRHRMGQEIRKYMDSQDFLEIETPYLIKSTPEGARDFVVPSRFNSGEFYALPQSPQTFKQILMVGGYDRYFQIVRCFRDEDLRADRQPEFTQIDCEMAFVDREDILSTFEGLAKHLFKNILNIEFKDAFPRISYEEAMSSYGSDKPDIRFDMQIQDVTNIVTNKGFAVFDNAEFTGAICAKGCAEWGRKQIDKLTDFVKQPQFGAKGMVYIKVGDNIQSSIDKFFSQDNLNLVVQKMGANKGDIILLLSGVKKQMLNALGALRLEVGNICGLRDNSTFKPLWVVDFPLFEYDDETKRYYAMHHPFTSPHKDDMSIFESNPDKVRANAYDFVVNGVEIGGGSIRIHDSEIQKTMFKLLGFSQEEAEKQFGFIINAFRYGAPPHGGIAFGFDRWCAIFGGSDSIRDYIAFPKNNMGRDTMIDSPSMISDEQLNELSIEIRKKE